MRVNSYNDYYPFGWEMSGRSFGTDFAYNFNGKRTDKWNGDNGSYLDFGARIQDARLGRFMSMDAHKAYYPSYSPYSFAADDPISLVDVDGNDWGVTITTNPDTGEKTLKFSLKAAVIITAKTNQTSKSAATLIANGLKVLAQNLSLYNNMNIEFDLDIRGIKTTAEIQPDDHVLEFADYKVMKSEETGQQARGKAQFYGKYVAYSLDALDGYSDNSNLKTIPHELFHTLGLRHIFEGIDEVASFDDELYNFPLELAQLPKHTVKQGAAIDNKAQTNVMDYKLENYDQLLNKRQIATAAENIKRKIVNKDNIPTTDIAIRNIAKFRGKPSGTKVDYNRKNTRAKAKLRMKY